MADTKEVIYEISDFKGLNKIKEPNKLDDNEFFTCTNLDILEDGGLKKRTGLKWPTTSVAPAGGGPLVLLGFFNTSAFNRLIVWNKSNNNLYYTGDGGATYTLIGGPYTDIEYGLQYFDKFYIIRSGNTILEYTGAAIAAIAGSPSGTVACVHKDRLFVLNRKAAGTLVSRLYFSSVANFSSWPGTNFIDFAPGDSVPLVALYSMETSLLVFKMHSTYQLTVQGDPADWDSRLFYARGCSSKYGVCEVNGIVYWTGIYALYSTDGISVSDLSSSKINLLASRTLYNYYGTSALDFDYLVPISHRKLLWGVANGDGAFPAGCYTFFIDKDAFTSYSFSGKDLAGVSYTIKPGYWVFNPNQIVGVWDEGWHCVDTEATYTNRLLAYETRGNYYMGLLGRDAPAGVLSGIQFIAQFVTKSFEFTNQKIGRVKYLGIEANIGPSTNPVFWFLNSLGGVIFVGTPFVSTGGEDYYFRVRGPGMARNVAVWIQELDNNGAAASPFELYRIELAVSVQRTPSRTPY